MGADKVEILSQRVAKIQGEYALGKAPFGRCDDPQIISDCDLLCRYRLYEGGKSHLVRNCLWSRRAKAGEMLPPVLDPREVGLSFQDESTP